jgi:hypothetical protein
LAVLAPMLPRIVLDGEREVAGGQPVGGGVARRAVPLCALIGLLEAGGLVIRAGSSTTVELTVAGLAGLGCVFGTAMANALLWAHPALAAQRRRARCRATTRRRLTNHARWCAYVLQVGGCVTRWW